MTNLSAHRLAIEVTILTHGVYKDLNLKLIGEPKPSCNGWIDIILEGKKEDLLTFLKEYMDEGEEYFEDNLITL